MSIFSNFLTCQKQDLTKQKFLWLVIAPGHPLKIILSPAKRHTCNVVHYLTALILTELDRGLRPFGCRRSLLSYSGSIFEQLLCWLNDYVLNRVILFFNSALKIKITSYNVNISLNTVYFLGRDYTVDKSISSKS